MRRQPTGRVIVGVDDSLAGLRALREAAGLARRFGTQLVALRACRPSAPGAALSCWPAAGPEAVPVDLCEQLARCYVDHAFREAMGTIPRDVPVEILVDYHPARQALTAAARDDADLLVIGESRRHPWWPLHRSVGRYCAAHARCPVLIVPPHQAAREPSLTRRPWDRLRKQREFAALLPGTS
jgi:nucleotide-binding universal stress UspA family protein